MPLTIGIGDPRRGIQNPGLSWIPLNGATRRCSHPRYPAKLGFIDDFYFFNYFGSVNTTANRLKFNCKTAVWTSSVFLYGGSIEKHWVRKMWVKMKFSKMASDRGSVMATPRKQAFILRGSPVGFLTPVIPTQNFMQSRNPEGYFWHPTTRAYFQSQISLWFCF